MSLREMLHVMHHFAWSQPNMELRVRIHLSQAPPAPAQDLVIFIGINPTMTTKYKPTLRQHDLKVAMERGVPHDWIKQLCKGFNIVPENFYGVVNGMRPGTPY